MFEPCELCEPSLGLWEPRENCEVSNGYMPDCRVELRDTVNPSKPFGCDVRRGVGDLTGVVERGGDEVVILNVPSTWAIDMEPDKGRSPL